MAKDSTSIIIETADFAARKHRDQRRKDSKQTPYINHPIGVAKILTDEGDESTLEVIQAALLHDTVEDTDTTIQEIEQVFGSKVASIVSEVTDDKSLPKAEGKQAQIDSAKGKSREAKLVKLADKIYNLRDLERELPVGWTEQRRHEYFIWARKVVQQCYEVNEPLAKILRDIFHRNIKENSESAVELG